jgi:hypothetical protein
MSQNRSETDKPKRAAPKTAFKKGVSGNPGGRPKRTVEELDLIAACKDRTPAALAVIESIMMKGENERNRLAAAQAIIERGHGKPTQPLSGPGGGPIQTVTEFVLAPFKAEQ